MILAIRPRYVENVPWFGISVDDALRRKAVDCLKRPVEDRGGQVGNKGEAPALDQRL